MWFQLDPDWESVPTKSKLFSSHSFSISQLMPS
jgi:hypothetical protein